MRGCSGLSRWGWSKSCWGCRWLERISFDVERNTLFINYEGFQVRTTDDVDLVRREVENRCKAIGRRIAVVVNYDSFTLDPMVSDAFFSMITYLQQRYYTSASRYTTSAFMRLKLGASLAERALRRMCSRRCRKRRRSWPGIKRRPLIDGRARGPRALGRGRSGRPGLATRPSEIRPSARRRFRRYRPHGRSAAPRPFRRVPRWPGRGGCFRTPPERRRRG